MALFEKKSYEEIRQSDSVEKKKTELSLSMQIIRDVQTHLHISTKLEHAVIPSKISVSRIPSPEFFKDKDALIKEVEFDEEKALREAEEARLKKEEEERQRLLAEEEAKKKAEEERLQKQAEEEARRIAEEEERLRLEQEAEQERLRLEEEAKLREEQERIQRELEEQARLQKEAEEEARRIAEEEERLRLEQEAEQERLRLEEEERIAQMKKNEVKITSITALNAKRPKGKVVAKIGAVKSGGLAAQKAEEEKLKEQEESRKKALLQQKLAAQRAAERAAEEERFKDAILIGDTKKADPDLGKFEIQHTSVADKPYKLVIKSNTGKVVFETSPIKSKPNELTAIMIKDIIKDGSFTFIKSPQGFAFRILDSRKRLFSVSKNFTSLRDAQLAAAAIKKFGLSANYIDDTTI